MGNLLLQFSIIVNFKSFQSLILADTSVRWFYPLESPCNPWVLLRLYKSWHPLYCLSSSTLNSESHSNKGKSLKFTDVSSRYSFTLQKIPAFEMRNIARPTSGNWNLSEKKEQKKFLQSASSPRVIFCNPRGQYNLLWNLWENLWENL